MAGKFKKGQHLFFLMSGDETFCSYGERMEDYETD